MIKDIENLKKHIDMRFEKALEDAINETMKEIDEMGKKWARDYAKRQMKIIMKEFNENKRLLGCNTGCTINE